MSTTSEHDSKHFEPVLDSFNGGVDVNANKTYDSKEIRKVLKKGVLRIGCKEAQSVAAPFCKRAKSRNKTIAKTRARVEHVFANLKQMTGD